MKKVLCILISILILASTCLAITPEEAAKDIGKYGIMGGFPDGTLRLEQNVTRAQMAKMIATMLGSAGSVNSSSSFKDVPNWHWATHYIEYARLNDIVGGFPDGTFKPEDNVTKDQVVKMVICALKFDKYMLSFRPSGAKLYYPADYISHALKNDLIVPGEYGDGSQPATRGFVAEIISKALDTPLPYDPSEKAYSFEAGNLDKRWDIADGKDGREHKTLRKTLENFGSVQS